MINLANNTSIVADNKVTFCGLEYLLTDKEAQQLKGILDGMLSTRSTGGSIVASSQTPVKTGSTPSTQPKAEKPHKNPQRSENGIPVAGYHVKKQTAVDGTALFCISRGTPDGVSKNNKPRIKDGGKIKCERECINAAIKALDNIVTIKVKGDDGGSFTAWGYKTKKKAEEMMATLPKSFTADECNKFFKEA